MTSRNRGSGSGTPSSHHPSTSSLRQVSTMSNTNTTNNNNNGAGPDGIGLAQELAEAIVHRIEGGDRAGRMVLILDDFYYSIQVKLPEKEV